MLYYTLSQGREFIAMTAAGAVMAAVALIFAAARRLMRAGPWLSLMCDCLMGAVWAAAACAALTVVCHGRARAYHFLAMLCGGALFMAGARGPLAALAAGTARLLRRAAVRLAGTAAVKRLLK